MVKAKVGEAVETPIVVENRTGSLVAGLTISSFTVKITYNGAADPDSLVVSVTEPFGDGRYIFTFTPTRVGRYSIYIDVPSPPTANGARYGQQFELELVDLDDLDTEITSGTYGLSALKDLIDLISTNAQIVSYFDEIKGSGWTNETLKAALIGINDCIKEAKQDGYPSIRSG